jgi:hypothetical protein
MSFKLFGNKGKKDFVFDEFKSQVENQGMKIDSIDEDGLIHISQGELTLNVSLDNVRKNYERDNDLTHISDLVETLVSYTIQLPDNWHDAKNSIYISLFPNDFDFNEFLHKDISDEFSKVYIHSGENKLTWITADDLEKWGIQEKGLEAQANINADKLLAKAVLQIENVEGHKLGLIETEHTTLKGALLFAPSMKEKAANDFGFPFYAVIPVRDFCYIFSENDFDYFAQRIGKVVVDEYKQSGYPITTEILKFTNTGVEAVGKYPVD